MSRRSHRHNRATDDDLYGNWAARDPPSGSHSSYVAGNSYTQHGSYDRGYGDSSYGAQSSYSYTGGDSNYGRQQQQYQEQSGGYGSQRSQGYSSGEDNVELTKRQIRVARQGSLSSTENRDFATRMAGGEISPTTLERLGVDQSLHYTGTNGRNISSNEFASRAGDSFSSQSRARDEEARIARRRHEMEERNRATEFSRRNRDERSRFQSNDSDMEYEDEYPGQDVRPAFVELSRRVLRDY